MYYKSILISFVKFIGHRNPYISAPRSILEFLTFKQYSLKTFYIRSYSIHVKVLILIDIKN